MKQARHQFQQEEERERKHLKKTRRKEKERAPLLNLSTQTQYRLEAKKSLGQNFLKNTTIIKKIVEAGEIKKSEIIIEIGPGTGALTEELLKSDGNVIIIEKDRRAIPILSERFKDYLVKGTLRIIEGDFLEIEIDTLLSESFVGGKEVGVPGKTKNSASAPINKPVFKIIANIPYYITGLIIRKSLELSHKPDRLIFLVQKEVAERMVKKGPNSGNNKEKSSILSQSTESYGQAELLCVVSRGNFVPAPKVDSAVIVIKNISNAKFEQNNIGEKAFFALIHAGFGHKRKKLIVNLLDFIQEHINQTTRESIKNELLSIFDEEGLGENTRAEDISNDIWFKISSKIIHKFGLKLDEENKV